MSSSEFSIQGDDSQVLTIAVAPNQTIQAEPGAMCFASNEMKQNTKLGGFMRMVAGEPIFKSTWVNEGAEPGFVALTNAIPSTIIPLNLDALGGSVLCARDAFMASINPDVKITVGLIPTASCLACCCSGLSPILQRVAGNGWVFLAAHGTIMQKILGPGEEIVVDTMSVVGCASSVTVDVVQTGGCSAICCSGEGLFNTTLKGPGIVLINSLPLAKLRRLFVQRQADRPPSMRRRNYFTAN
eukprot:CAMPEP_0116891400 /NCGR_PEP_ID=MMETSP0467-20121206/1825_1 /TAXON_ID=283647 /ORGANISM="Mesodinium pulex, Strain SPMC105" /LENGTH=241 /DNA_ID=CAMNT_0004559895 /DNA_START=30 /DNA_END=755 /DNA_ORIENTATION=-